MAIDDPIPVRTPPADDPARRVCAQPERKEWVACMVAKADAIKDFKQQDRTGEEIERERRRACVLFIRGSATTPAPAPPTGPKPTGAMPGT